MEMDFMKAVDSTEIPKVDEVPKLPEVKPPKELKPFDLDAAKKRFATYKDQINAMVIEAKDLVVNIPEKNVLAIEMMGQARKISKAIEELIKEILKPHNDFRNELNAFKKYFVTSLESIVNNLKKKSEDFSAALILEQRKKEKAEAEARAKLQKQINKDAKEAGVETVQLPDVPQKEVEKKGITRTEAGSSLSITMVWQGTIIDPKKVPWEYCIPDQKKIDEAVKAGAREITGVEIKEVPKSRLRA